MKNMKKGLVGAILEAVAIVLLFLPATYLQKLWVYDQSAFTYHGRATLTNIESLSFSNIVFQKAGIFVLLGLIVFALMVAGLSLFALEFFHKEENLYPKAQKLVLALELISYVLFSVVAVSYVDDSTYLRVDMAGGYMMYIEIVLLAGLCSIPFFKTSYGKTKALGNGRTGSTHPYDETEAIKQYKELLDSGIITQEEFDAKKKQLLGL